MFRPSRPLIALILAIIPSVAAQKAPDTAALKAAQIAALAPFKAMDGQWRGEATFLMLGGAKRHVTQTERVGPLLDGAIRLIEGRGYDAEGRTSFNAVAILSFNPATGQYSLQSHAEGNAGTFPVTKTADGFIWEIPAGPMTIRYTATLNGERWQEVGDRLMPGKDPIRFFEMTLTKIGASDWPAANAVPHK